MEGRKVFPIRTRAAAMGVQVTNNTVIRGWTGAGLLSPDLPGQNITITGSHFVMQNRWILFGAAWASSSTMLRAQMSISRITRSDMTGAGTRWMHSAGGSRHNAIVTGKNLVRHANRTTRGRSIAGLEDTDPVPPSKAMGQPEKF